MERSLRKERVGLVVSDKMDKTVVVEVTDKENILFTRKQSLKLLNLKRTMKKTLAVLVIK